jgi:hypothetical protein
MKRVVAFILGAAAVATVAWGGHEAPIYPSFYPHEIEIRTLAPDQAASALREGRIQAYVGAGASLPDAPPAEIGLVESLGAFITVRVNPGSRHAQDDAAACAVAGTVMRALAAQADFVPHPYPVTPFHGDYLHPPRRGSTIRPSPTSRSRRTARWRGAIRTGPRRAPTGMPRSTRSTPPRSWRPRRSP